MEGGRFIEAVTTLMGNVLTLCGTVITYILDQPILAIGVGCSIARPVAGLFRTLKRI